MSMTPEDESTKPSNNQLTLTLPSVTSAFQDRDGVNEPAGSPSLSPSSPSNHAASDQSNTDRPRTGGSHRQRSMSRTQEKAGSNEPKRKRSRVTPEQLAHLERFFATDRSPTAAKRREISDLLGMQERQTQIWFQNRYLYCKGCSWFTLTYSCWIRRAKAKLFDGKQEQDFLGLPPDVPSTLTATYDPELNALLHENDRAFFLAKIR